jgi:peptidoglycan/LPS O-acetylase OafA/YrhL
VKNKLSGSREVVNSKISGRIATLDVLRFFAAFAVVLYHFIARPEATAFQSFEPVVRFGYLGVPIFFMISGYVISLSAENGSAYKFAVSRFVRLYPALWFSVLFTVVVVTLLGDDRFGLIQVLINLTLLNDYFDYPNVDDVYWTLQTELKFYACIFTLVLTGLFKYYHVWLSVWLAATVAYVLTQQPYFMGWFISPSYSAFFIVGISFYLIQRHGFDGYNLSVLATTSALCAFYAHKQAPEFIRAATSHDAIIASVIVLVAVILFIGIAKSKFNFRNGRLAYSLGALTYPLYLLHNKTGKAVIDSSLFLDVPQGFLIVGVTLAMIALSYAVFLYIERPSARMLKKVLL